MPLPDPARTAAVIHRRTRLRPLLGMVLGSGFGGVAAALELERELSYSSLPGFPQAGVPGHAGELRIGRLGGVEVAVLCGRAHFYEGYDPAQTTFPIRVLAALGVRTVLLTNAAGGIAPALRAGDFMLVRDHINGMGVNPLRGAANPFVDLSEAYDAGLRRLLKRSARTERIPLREGVYMAVPGPSYETPAEIVAFGRLGASAVGMSTVPETIVARHCGMEVAAVSCITNLAAGRGGRGARLDHADVLEQARRREEAATRLVTRFAIEWAAAGARVK